MQKSKSLSELLARGGKRLSLLKARSAERSAGCWRRFARPSPPGCQNTVVSAGLEQGRLTIGVVGAVWASRLRYSTEIIRKRLARCLRCSKFEHPNPGRPAPGLG